MFIDISIIQSLPPSNANRSQNGSAKTISYGGTNRARLSSQSQKRAARMWYRDNAKSLGIDRSQLAERSRRWSSELAKLITVGTDDERFIIAKLVQAVAQRKPGNIFDGIDKESDILFLGHSEAKAIAHYIDQNWADLEELARHGVWYANASEDERKADKWTPSAKEVKPLQKAWCQVGTVPGEVAIFGRMMSNYSPVSVDGSVQVADAISVNSQRMSKTRDGMVLGEVDFFTAVDDIDPLIVDDETGSAHLGERGIVAPVYYRYANICTSHLSELIGDEAPLMARAFIEGFIKSLPDGFINSHAHMTLPEAVILTVHDSQPYNPSQAFLSAINAGDKGDRSIADLALTQLIQTRNDINETYGIEPLYQGITTVGGDGRSLAENLDSAIGLAFET